MFVMYTRQAWQKLGAMPPEDAMEKYLDIVSELYPTWTTGLTVVSSFVLVVFSFSLYQYSCTVTYFLFGLDL